MLNSSLNYQRSLQFLPFSKWRTNDVQFLFFHQEYELIGEMDEAEKDDIIDKNSSYMGILDERFYTLIHPRVLGIEKFWTVVHCYWHAYLTLVDLSSVL